MHGASVLVPQGCAGLTSCSILQGKGSTKKGAGGGGMFRGLIDTIIGNLQLSIGNVHVRYEVSPFDMCFLKAHVLPSRIIAMGLRWHA